MKTKKQKNTAILVKLNVFTKKIQLFPIYKHFGPQSILNLLSQKDEGYVVQHFDIVPIQINDTVYDVYCDDNGRYNTDKRGEVKQIVDFDLFGNLIIGLNGPNDKEIGLTPAQICDWITLLKTCKIKTTKPSGLPFTIHSFATGKDMADFLRNQ